MMINGLLCKVIFDHNPTNDFYVEESFPLDWMYPYETPSGIIMKINRNPLPSIPDEVFKKDHEFWSKYSERLCGNWITYDTTVQQIADFAEKVYLHNNYEGFTGDRKFVRDDDAQKAFSKLRSSIAGVYAWRLVPQFCPPEYRPKNDAEYQALVRETDFAFKQAFAFCPYSPEAVYRYVNFLLPLGRFDDALIVAQTCQKLDPYNGALVGLVQQLEEYKKQSDERAQIESQLQPMENDARTNPADFENIYKLGAFYQRMQQTNLTAELFKQAVANAGLALTNPKVRFQDVAALAQMCAQSGDLPKLETLLQKMVEMNPDQPEVRYDLASLQSVLGKKTEALQNLKTALDLSTARLKTNSAAHDLLSVARTDQRLDGLRDLPEFKKLVPP
jgi:tetratricopeptide (TPR) repeat protein